MDRQLSISSFFVFLKASACSTLIAMSNSTTFSKATAENDAGRSRLAVTMPLFFRFLRLGYNCCLVTFKALASSCPFFGPFLAR